MFIRYIVKPLGLHARLRVETVPEARSGFAKVVRQSDNIEVSTICLQNIRGGLEMTEQGAVDLITTDQMRIVVQRLDRVLSDMVWNGDTDNSVNGYRECDGIVKQSALLAKTIEWTDSFDFDAFFQNHQDDTKDKGLLGLSWYVAARPCIFNKFKFSYAPKYWNLECVNIADAPITPHTFASDIYILPLSKELEDNGIYLQRVDYSKREMKLDKEGETHWRTDDGEFLWEPQRCKWDFCIDCQVEFRIIVPRPELVTIIKNVSIAHLEKEG